MDIHPDKIDEIIPHLNWILLDSGRLANSFFNKEIKVELKEDQSPVTVADKTVEKHLRKLLGKYFPDIGIFGEEQGEELGSNKDFRFVVDPIDGTRSFISGIPLWGTLLALEFQGNPILGAMYAPLFDQVLIGSKGFGCFLGEEEQNINLCGDIAKARLILNDYQLCIQNDQKTFADNLISKVSQVRGWGDCHGYFMVATGQSEIMYDPYIEYYDVAPMRPIIEGAGGAYFSLDGSRDFSSKNAIACSKDLKEKILELI